MFLRAIIMISNNIDNSTAYGDKDNNDRKNYNNDVY